jgi:hypothetical protein
MIKQQIIYKVMDENTMMLNYSTWCSKFLPKTDDNERFLSFIEETNIRLMERASWQDDCDVENLKHLNIKTLYYEHINELGEITSLVDIYDEDTIFGTIEELEPIYKQIRDTLWNNGVLQQLYEETQDYTEEEIIWFIANNYEDWV